MPNSRSERGNQQEQNQIPAAVARRFIFQEVAENLFLRRFIP
jgi:hypothetical protein